MKAGTIALALGLLATGGLVVWAAAGGKQEGTGTAPSQVPGTAPVDPGGTPVPGPAAPTAEQAFSDPVQCKACHAEAWEEWSASMHSKAWTDPEVRALSDNFRSTECLSCHVPQPIHSAPVGGRVFERSSRFESGVNCLTCHLLPDGAVAAIRDIPGAPCRPRKVDTLRQAVSCKGCHNQHYLVDEWETLYSKPDAAKGALLMEGGPGACVDCHMAPAARRAGPDGKERKGHDHVFKGGHYEEVLRRGIRLQARLEDGSVVAEVENSGTGHRAPADSRHRSFNVWVTITTESGVKVQDRAEIAEYRMYYRSPPRENTNLRPGEKGVSKLPLPKGLKGKVLVELVYAMNPVKKEQREAKKVHSVELEFDTTK